MSIVWIGWLSDILVDTLGIIGLMFGIDSAFLGITVLAWGNSVGDMVANIGVAKRGMAKMAIVGCFAGPLFNLCIGLGASMTKSNLDNRKAGTGAPAFNIRSRDNLLPILVIFPLMLQLVI
jgi:Ca2+/Na+ antiporter